MKNCSGNLLSDSLLRAVAILVLVTPAACDVPDEDAKSSPTMAIDVLAIKASINSGDVHQILKTLNALKMAERKGEALEFLESVWWKRRDLHPDLNWAIVNQDIIRLEIANILAQAIRNGRSRVDADEVHLFTVELIRAKHSDPEILRTGVLTVSIFDRPEDVPLLVKIALEENKDTFRAAILALAKMCAPEAGESLAFLSKTVSSSAAKDIITESWEEMESFKSKTGWCKEL